MECGWRPGCLGRHPHTLSDLPLAMDERHSPSEPGSRGDPLGSACSSIRSNGSGETEMNDRKPINSEMFRRRLSAAIALAILAALAAPASAQREDNPYVGAGVYVNPEWSANAATEPGGSAIANQPTAVWMDRIAAIQGVNGGMSLRDHLDAALGQAGGQPLVIQLVIYN